MILSMTGFGAAVSKDASESISVEIKSVNNRFLQIKTRMPGMLAALEDPMGQRIKKTMARGSVSVNLSVKGLTVGGPQLNTAQANAMVKTFKSFAKKADLEGPVTPETVTRFPDIWDQGVLSPKDLSRISKNVLKATDQALAQLAKMRQKEGKFLNTLLQSHLKQTEKLVAGIKAHYPKTLDAHRKALAGRMDQVLEKPLPQDILTRELALLVDRSDISEEIGRMGSHIGQMKKFLGSKDAVGKRLDFLAQEMHREANTMGSKSQDAKLSHLVIDLKNEIEKIREQVQNVE